MPDRNILNRIFNRGTIVSVIALSLLACIVFSAPALAMDNPPYLVSPFPEPGSQNNAFDDLTVKAGICDDETAVDTPIIVVLTVGTETLPPIFEPILEESFGGKGYTMYLDMEEYLPPGTPYGEIIKVAVHARDTEGNTMMDSWEFTLAEMKFNEQVHPLYPLHDMPLSYSGETGKVRFSWTNGIDKNCYRLAIKPGGQSEITMDFVPGGYETDFGIITIEFDAEKIQWELLSNLGTLEWRVAPIACQGGELLSNYSPPSTARYVYGDLSLLMAPTHMAQLKADLEPEFRWSLSTPLLDTYHLVFVKYDKFGQFTQEIHTSEMGFPLESYPFTQSTWDTFSPGEWGWTVIGEYAPGLFTDFMIYKFTKREKEQ